MRPIRQKMSTDSTTAVIVPVFNRSRLVVKTLECVRAQILKPRRLIIIDDCSTDDSVRVIRRWIEKYSPPFETLVLVNEKNIGAAATRNRGMEYANDCRFVHFLDSDDRPPRSFLEKAVQKMTSDRSLVAASADKIGYNDDPGTGAQMEHRLTSLSHLAANPVHWFLYQGAGVASCTLFRSEIITRLGGFNPQLPTGHDTELFMRVANAGRWGHFAGHPVLFFSEEQKPHHLHRRYYDFGRRWALLHEHCINNSGLRRHLGSTGNYRAAMALRWHLAGWRLLWQRKFAEANNCLRRSLGWRLTGNRALLYLLASPLLKIHFPSDKTIKRMLTFPWIRRIFPYPPPDGLSGGQNTPAPKKALHRTASPPHQRPFENTAPLAIDVIIPVSNRVASPNTLLANLAQQSLPPRRVIIAGDGCRNGFAAAVQQWRDDNEPAFEIEYAACEQNSGICAARNSGLRRAQGSDCVHFLNPTDILDPLFLQKASAMLAADPGMVAVSSDCVFIGGGSERPAGQSILRHNPWKQFLLHGADIASCTLVRTAAALEVHGFNPVLQTTEDAEFFCQIANLGKWGYIPECLVRHMRKKAHSHLPVMHEDDCRRRAQILENCVDNFGIRENVKAAIVRSEMARRWRDAGRELFVRCRYEEAEECFRRSLAWRASKNACWLYLLLMLPLKRRGTDKGG